MGTVVLVAGPPCAGKSTYVAEHAAPGDLVADFDAFAQRAGSPVAHGHSPEHRRAAGLAMDAALAAIATHRHCGTAWVIRSAPRRRVRAALAYRLRARVVLLDPGYGECIARARRDGRPASCEQGIWLWYRQAGRG